MFRSVIESLIDKRVTELKILKTDARFEDVIKPVAARHNYLNSFFNDHSSFDGNSVAL